MFCNLTNLNFFLFGLHVQKTSATKKNESIHFLLQTGSRFEFFPKVAFLLQTGSRFAFFSKVAFLLHARLTNQKKQSVSLTNGLRRHGLGARPTVARCYPRGRGQSSQWLGIDESQTRTQKSNSSKHTYHWA